MGKWAFCSAKPLRGGSSPGRTGLLLSKITPWWVLSWPDGPFAQQNHSVVGPPLAGRAF